MVETSRFRPRPWELGRLGTTRRRRARTKGLALPALRLLRLPKILT